jgi:hypothetical protein
MKIKSVSVSGENSEIRRELKALRLAAKDAKRLAEITGTPFVIMRNGKLVNLH